MPRFSSSSVLLCAIAPLLFIWVCYVDGVEPQDARARGGLEPEKGMIEDLIRGLSQACTDECSPQAAKAACERACRTRKAGKLRGIIRRLREQKGKVRAKHQALTGQGQSGEGEQGMSCVSSLDAAAVCALCMSERAFTLPFSDVASPDTYTQSTSTQRETLAHFLGNVTQGNTQLSSLFFNDTALAATLSSGLGGLCLAAGKVLYVAESLKVLGVPVERGAVAGGVPRDVNGGLGHEPVLAVRVRESAGGFDMQDEEDAIDRLRAAFKARSNGTDGALGEQAARKKGDDVYVLWACGVNGTVTLAPHMQVNESVCAVHVEDPFTHDPPRSFVLSGSVEFGSVGVRVVGVEEPASRYGSLYGEVPNHVPVGDVLQGFGCNQTGLSGAWEERCDPLPWGMEGDMDERLRGMGLQTFSLSQAMLNSAYDTRGGEAFHRLRGNPSVFDVGCTAYALAGFSTHVASEEGSDGGEGEAIVQNMHFALAFAFDAQSNMELSSLIRQMTGVPASGLLQQFGVRKLTVFLSKSDTPEDALFLSPLASSLPKGVTIAGTVGFTEESLMDDIMRKMTTFPAAIRIKAQASPGPMAFTSDDKISVTFSQGASLMDGKFQMEVGGEGRGDFETTISGGVIIPISVSEVIEMKGQLKLLPKTGSDEGGVHLSAILESGLTSLFGVGGMEISFAVVSQRVFGTKVARFVLQAVLRLGVGCVSERAQKLHKATLGGFCIEGPVLVGVDPQSPTEDFLVSEVKVSDAYMSLTLGHLLTFVGVDTKAQDAVLRVMSMMTFAGESVSLSYSLLRHSFYGGDAVLYDVPAGFAGQGHMNFWGLSALACVWVSDLGLGTFVLNCDLPPVRTIDGVSLTRAADSSEGGVIKLDARVGLWGEASAVEMWIQGYASVWGMAGETLVRVQDEGYDFAMRGRVYTGVEVSFRATAPLGPLMGSVWRIRGNITQESLDEISVRLDAHYDRICEADTQRCVGEKGHNILVKEWVHLCYAEFSTDLQEADKEGKDGRVFVRFGVTVWGERRDLGVRMSLGDLDLAAQQVAEAAYEMAVRSPLNATIAARKHCAEPLPAPLMHALPGSAKTVAGVRLPSREVLAALFERDNWNTRVRQTDPDMWVSTQRSLAEARYRAAEASFEARKAAFEYDEQFRSATIRAYTARLFPEAPPRRIETLQGPVTDSYDDGQGEDVRAFLGKTFGSARKGAGFRDRINRISSRLAEIGRRLKARASRKIDDYLGTKWAHLVSNIRLTEAQEDSIRDARKAFQSVRSLQARRGANEAPTDMPSANGGASWQALATQQRQLSTASAPLSRERRSRGVGGASVEARSGAGKRTALAQHHEHRAQRPHAQQLTHQEGGPAGPSLEQHGSDFRARGRQAQ